MMEYIHFDNIRKVNRIISYLTHIFVQGTSDWNIIDYMRISFKIPYIRGRYGQLVKNSITF